MRIIGYSFLSVVVIAHIFCFALVAKAVMPEFLFRLSKRGFLNNKAEKSKQGY